MYLFGLLFSLLFLAITIKFIVSRSLNLGISLLWLFFSFVFIILSYNRKIIDTLAIYFDIYYPPSLMFLLGILACFSLILYLMIRISTLHKQLVRLSQEVGILKSEKGNSK